MTDLRQSGKAIVDRWVIEKVGDKLFLKGEEISPGTIDVKLDGLTYRSSEKVEVRQQASEEQYLIEQIELLQRSYEKAAKPFIERLISLRTIELPKPIFIPKIAANGIKEA